jgi:PAS domain S-box-containing protein
MRILFAVQVLAVVGLLRNLLKKKNRETKLAWSTFRMAMQTGKSIGWELGIAGGGGFLFGDLRSFFGIPSDSHTASLQEFFNYIHPEDRQRVTQTVADARQNHHPYSVEFRIGLHGQAARWVEARGEFQYAPGGTPTRMLGLAFDVTERRAQAERAVRESEGRFRLIAEAAPVAIWMSDIKNTCVYANQRWIELTGGSFEGKAGNSWRENIHPEDLGRYQEKTTEGFNRREPFRVEYRLRQHDGEFIWIIDSGTPRFNTDVSFAGYIGSAVDINEIKLAEQVLSTMSRKLIEAHEAERAWIAAELHDDIGQRLALQALKFRNLESAIAVSQPALSKDVEQLRHQLESLGNDTQLLSRTLHPSKLRYLGLAKTAESFCKQLSTKTAEINFQAENIPKDLPEGVSLCLYRVLQEALQNAIKHSGSQRFEVALRGGSDEVRLSVHDSGIGFDPALAVKGEGIGIHSMKERLKLVNGSLSIDSQPHHGTTIHARVPLDSRRKARGTSG